MTNDKSISSAVFATRSYILTGSYAPQSGAGEGYTSPTPNECHTQLASFDCKRQSSVVLLRLTMT